MNNLFFTKNDPQDPRMGDYATVFSPEKVTADSIVIVGYADDEGIGNNSGRIGASRGPEVIKRNFYKYTPHLFKNDQPKILDFDLLQEEDLKKIPLEKRHERAKDFIKKTLLLNARTIALGGGHDYGYPDGAAFLEVYKDQKPLVINFDAHLDVRPLKDKITSGTPFYRLLKDYKDFDFLEVGAQSQCNSRFHMEWAEGHGAKILGWDEIQYSGKNYHTKILEFLEPYLLKKRPTYLSIDIDAFSSTYAPGASQVFATGFAPENFFPVLNVILERLDVRLLGIYEVCPPLDSDEKTSRLAAQILWEYCQK